MTGSRRAQSQAPPRSMTRSSTPVATKPRTVSGDLVDRGMFHSPEDPHNRALTYVPHCHSALAPT